MIIDTEMLFVKFYVAVPMSGYPSLVCDFGFEIIDESFKGKLRFGRAILGFIFVCENIVNGVSMLL